MLLLEKVRNKLFDQSRDEVRRDWPGVRVVALKDLPHKLASLSHLLRTIRLRGVRRPDHNDNHRRQQTSQGVS